MSFDSVECSDEESYFDSSVVYRTSPKGSRIWEPSGVDIIRLYEEIEATGCNKLEWQCPGRISPSQLNQNTESQYADLEGDDNSGDNGQMKSKFDFDNDFEDATLNSTSNTRVTKRTQAVKKTNLSKVMLDIKKYQMIDQKGTKSKAPSVSANPSQVQTMPSMSRSSSHIANRHANSSIQSSFDQDLDSKFDQFP